MLGIFGCGGPSMVPSSTSARQALDVALNTWKDGKPPSSTSEHEPPLVIADNDWVSGKKLRSYEIGEEIPAEDGKRFKVKLEIENTAEPLDATYVVVGNSPVSIIRLEDYERTLSMDNNPAPVSKKKRSR